MDREALRGPEVWIRLFQASRPTCRRAAGKAKGRQRRRWPRRRASGSERWRLPSPHPGSLQPSAVHPRYHCLRASSGRPAGWRLWALGTAALIAGAVVQLQVSNRPAGQLTASAPPVSSCCRGALPALQLCRLVWRVHLCASWDLHSMLSRHDWPGKCCRREQQACPFRALAGHCTKRMQCRHLLPFNRLHLRCRRCTASGRLSLTRFGANQWRGQAA